MSPQVCGIYSGYCFKGLPEALRSVSGRFKWFQELQRVSTKYQGVLNGLRVASRSERDVSAASQGVLGPFMKFQRRFRVFGSICVVLRGSPGSPKAIETRFKDFK